MYVTESGHNVIVVSLQSYVDVEAQQAGGMLQPQLAHAHGAHGTLPHEQFLHGEFPALASPLGGGVMYGVQHAHDGSPYYQPNAGSGMDSPLDVGGQLGLARGGYASPGGGVGGVGGAYSSSPRHYASPRSQPYSPGPQRLAATPQPQQQVSLRCNNSVLFASTSHLNSGDKNYIIL